MDRPSNALPGPSSLQPISPLLPGWTEHVAPTGHLYWHNAEKGFSTYLRPGISSIHPNNGSRPIYTGPPPGFEDEKVRRKKEKPKIKEPIPYTDGWLRVITNHGNVFYANKETKKSQWTIPDQIRGQVEHMDDGRTMENGSVHERRQRRDVIESDVNPRKRAHDETREVRGKKKRSVQATKDKEVIDDDDNWQHQIAAEMAEEAEAIERRTNARKVPIKPKVSLEDGKLQFMEMLSKLNGTKEEINAMAPWDKELPKFVNLPEYLILEDLSDRQDAFNDWCRNRIREKRAEKDFKATDKATKSDNSIVSYKSLLESEVKSTRMHWDDFRKTWKKDRRFFSFGRDDREREKAFREWLKELGEKKRKAAQQSEIDFLHLLDEYLSHSQRLDSNATLEESQKLWSLCKRTEGLDRDSRYEAVGSSTRRAQLFEEWAKGSKRHEQEQTEETQQQHESIPKPINNRDAAGNALRMREEEVSRKRRLIQGEKTRTLGKALYEEEATNFQQLLIDAVRDPLSSLDETFVKLSKDQRFNTQILSKREKEDLFYHHIDRLEERRLRLLENVFERYAPTLDVDKETALPLTLDDDEVERKQLLQLKSVSSGRKTTSDLFDEWQSRREKEAQTAFNEMLKENAFLDFWGRLKQEYEQQKAGKGEDNTTEDVLPTADDEEDQSSAPDQLQMAATIKLDEIHSILRDDQRYRAFQHKPDLRETWIREYLQQMELPKKSVYQK